MTMPPGDPNHYGYQPPPPPPYGAHSPYPPPYGMPGPGYGRFDPYTGEPLSEKSKLVAGLLQILVPLGIGRMYIGDIGMGIAQLVVTLVTCGLGSLWPFIDGILILVNGARDEHGLKLRD
ncbi:TM2 domain-containing protein [Pseudonocardiaceae bacterium YIM PH 21723]|nr:TM2 domain-containing protein [Pseudonocardiaceae bacterium YIM PH 21723]